MAVKSVITLDPGVNTWQAAFFNQLGFTDFHSFANLLLNNGGTNISRKELS
jgi:hypothetical protein